MKMKIKMGGACLLTCFLMLTNTTVQAAESGCIPSFLEEKKKYKIGMGKRLMKVKVVKIDATSCWISVKEIFPKLKSSEVLSSEKTAPFWININNVSVIRNKK